MAVKDYIRDCIKEYMGEYTEPLCGKTVAITGTTGGIGISLVRHLASLGANLIFIDRNKKRQDSLRAMIKAFYPDVSVKLVCADLSDIDSVKAATEVLKGEEIDIFIHNAGAYSIPRKVCDKTELDNVFQINFLSPYYMIRELLPNIKARGGKVNVVGSIAYNYSKIDKEDVDFKNKKRASLVYGNAKKYLMYSFFDLFREEREAHLAVTHPGIALTNITAHYPKPLFAVIKHPMKVIFMSPYTASVSVVRGVFEDCAYGEWVGPKVFGIWGLPKKRKLRALEEGEGEFIAKIAAELYEKVKAIEFQPIEAEAEEAAVIEEAVAEEAAAIEESAVIEEA